MSEQTLTILMPVYNAARYVAEAVDSVLAQTYPHFQLHLIDDGSTDETLDICRTYAERDRRIQLWTHDNVGIANTMNTALQRVRADWVFCMHGDDVMMPNRLERQLVFIRENADVAVVSSVVALIDTEGREIGRTKSPHTDAEAVARQIARGECVAFNHPACAFRADIVRSVGGYRQAFWPAEDTELWNRIAAHGYGVLVQDECLLKYRIHGEAASTRKSRLMIQKLAWMTSCMESRRFGHPEPSWEEFLSEQEHAPLMTRLNNRRKEAARTMYQSAVHYFATRQYRALLPAIAGAALLEPSLVLPRLLPRLIAPRLIARRGASC